MKNLTITTILVLIASLIVSFVLTNVTVWLICWIISILDIGIALQFSWKLALCIWLLITVIKCIIK